MPRIKYRTCLPMIRRIPHYNDVIMMASQIAILAIVYSTIYSRRRRPRRLISLLLCMSSICCTTHGVTKHCEHDIQLHDSYCAVWFKIMYSWRTLYYIWTCSYVHWNHQTIQIGKLCICGEHDYVRMDYIQGKPLWTGPESPPTMTS